jgi:hypothetical protein
MPDDYADDVLRGAREIADYRREPVRRTNYLLEKRLVPGAYKMGRLWELRKSTHDRGIAELDAAALARITA